MFIRNLNVLTRLISFVTFLIPLYANALEKFIDPFTEQQFQLINQANPSLESTVISAQVFGGSRTMESSLFLPPAGGSSSVRVTQNGLVIAENVVNSLQAKLTYPAKNVNLAAAVDITENNSCDVLSLKTWSMIFQDLTLLV